MSASAATDSTQIPANTRSTGSIISRWILRFLILALIVAGGWLFVMIAGRVEGTQFCPDDFSERSFSFYQIPFLRIQVSGVKYKNYKSTVSQFLTNEGLLQPATGTKQWHPVRDNKSDEDSIHFDARLLHAYLDQYDSNYDEYWIAWSKKNPDLAAAFWPLVASLARDRLYADLPSLFDSVNDLENSKQSVSLLRNNVAELYIERGLESQTAKDHSDAIRYFDKAAVLGADAANVDPLKQTSVDAGGEVDEQENFDLLKPVTRIKPSAPTKLKAEKLKAEKSGSVDATAEESVGDDLPAEAIPDDGEAAEKAGQQ